MKRSVRFRRWLTFCLFFCLLTGTGLAQSGGTYDLVWTTINGGAASSSGNGYALNSSVGQSEAGVIQSNGYTIAGGFWHAPQASSTPDTPEQPTVRVYLPLVQK